MNEVIEIFYTCEDCEAAVGAYVEIYDDGTLYEESWATPESQERVEAFQLEHGMHKIDTADENPWA